MKKDWRQKATPAERAYQTAFGAVSSSLTARKLAYDTLLRLRMINAPFDPWRVATDLGIDVEEVFGLEAQGTFASSPSRPRIRVRAVGLGDDGFTKSRQSFTLAHEIGHFVFRKAIEHATSVSLPTSQDPFEERFCDTFASELLMPRFAFSNALTSVGVKPSACLQLTKQFGVSLSALLYQIRRYAGNRRRFAAVIRARTNSGLKLVWSTSGSVWSFVPHKLDTAYIDQTKILPNDVFGDEDWFDGRTRRSWNCASIAMPGSTRILTIGRRPGCKLSFVAAQQAQLSDACLSPENQLAFF